MNNAYLSNPIINIDFNSLGLEGWILIKASFRSNKRVRGRAVRIQDYAIAGIQGHAIDEAPMSVACLLLYVVKASLSFLFFHEADGEEELEKGEGK